jgi:aspartyl/asparaginyl-tRNA synthetase
MFCWIHSEGFIEIHTPKITPGVSEGGSDVFKLDYFGTKCCLAQSPQLFKQMAVVSDLFKVFEIGHVFRAENSNTHRHMCEFVGLDFEMEIKESYKEVTAQLGNCFNYIFEKINAHCQPELAAIQYVLSSSFQCLC